MVEVFKTNIDNELTADALVNELQSLFPCSTVNFDLEDCDRILRVKGNDINPHSVAAVLDRRGFICEALD